MLPHTFLRLLCVRCARSLRLAQLRHLQLAHTQGRVKMGMGRVGWREKKGGWEAESSSGIGNHIDAHVSGLSRHPHVGLCAAGSEGGRGTNLRR